MTAPKWNDITSYSRGDKQRTPGIFEMHLGSLRVSVHVLIGCPGWYATCRPFFGQRALPCGDDVDGAKYTALEWVRDEVNDVKNDLVVAMLEQEPEA